VRKALGAGADAVVLDLEDAVPAERKEDAREVVVAILRELRGAGPRPQVWARVNPARSSWGEADVEALRGLPVDGVRVPRTENPADIVAVATALDCPVQLLIETAVGLMAARDLAVAHPAVAGIGLGEADLASDLRVAASRGLDWARGWIVAVSRACGLPSPVQSVYTAVADLDGLRATTAEARDLGFFGRSVVHPRQIGPVHDVYRPSPDEAARAQHLVDTLQSAQARGEAAALTSDGRFVDPAVVSQARVILELAALDHPRPPAPTRSEEKQ
jgi:citrate lyase subunit beta/citryl-CoA lyase